MTRATLPVAAFLSATTATAATAAAVARRRWWSVVRLEDLLGAAGGPTSVATAINDAGVVVGCASGRAFRIESARLEWFSALGVGSRAEAISSCGHVVGATFAGDDDLSPVLWSPDGRVHHLERPDERFVGTAVDLTGAALASSVIVGWLDDLVVPGVRRAWVWADGVGQPLVPELSARTEAAAVNTAATIVGSVAGDLSVGHRVAAAWTGGGRGIELASLVSGAHSAAHDISDAGVIVGASTTVSGASHACVWPAIDQAPVDLGTLGGLRSCATGVNDFGVVVGWANNAEGKPRACAWVPPTTATTDYRTVDLGTLGGDTSVAFGLNNHHCIVGVASLGRGALSTPLRPGGWSWEDHAFATDLPSDSQQSR